MRDRKGPYSRSLRFTRGLEHSRNVNVGSRFEGQKSFEVFQEVEAREVGRTSKKRCCRSTWLDRSSPDGMELSLYLAASSVCSCQPTIRQRSHLANFRYGSSRISRFDCLYFAL